MRIVRARPAWVIKIGQAGPKLVFTAPEWEAFTAGVRDGEFDLG